MSEIGGGWIRQARRQRQALGRVVKLALASFFLSTIALGSAAPESARGAGTPSETPAMRSSESPSPRVPAAGTPIVSNARFEAAGDRTTVVLLTSSKLSVEAFALSAPYRLVVDMPEVRFNLATSARETRGVIRSWRAGLFATGRSRIVFDTTAPIRIASQRVEPRPDGSAELTLELQSISPEDFAADERARQQAKQAALTASTAGKTDRDVPHVTSGPRKLVIVLDPGHGGLDAGTVSPHSGMPEKQVVLEFSKILQKKLVDTGRYDVYMTRATDTFIPLGDRVKFARAHHADLFVSIHADAELDRSVRGSTVFTLSDKASDASAAALAQKENQSDALAGIVPDDRSDDVADILIDLVKRETRSFSHALAETLVDAMARSGHMVKHDPHRSAKLVVLKAYDFPSVLIELGFLSNKDDEAELESPKWRDQTSDSILTAIERFCAAHAETAPP